MIKMRDLVPYKHAVLCTFDGSDRVFENMVMSLRWMDDGRLSAMLDSYNFVIEEPDAELNYIVERTNLTPFEIERIGAFVLPPRPTTKTCEACGHVEPLP